MAAPHRIAIGPRASFVERCLLLGSGRGIEHGLLGEDRVPIVCSTRRHESGVMLRGWRSVSWSTWSPPTHSIEFAKRRISTLQVVSTVENTIRSQVENTTVSRDYWFRVSAPPETISRRGQNSFAQPYPDSRRTDSPMANPDSVPLPASDRAATRAERTPL